jgi:RNA polymerase sigma factor (sigma-70 family)
VTQSVFTDLARKARTVSANLSPEASFVGWLYRGTRFAARDLHRNQTRRTQRERRTMEQLDPAPETTRDWEQLRPVLDDAMSELDDTDREAVLLRYFKNHNLRTVGETLGISDDAAQKRVSRAVERLREIFAKRGVTVGTSGLAVAISTNAVQAAPVSLATTISTIAIASTACSGVTTLTILKIMSMTKLKVGIITALVAAGITIPLVVQHQAQTKLNAANEALRRQTERADQLAAENEELAKGATRASAPTANSNGPSLELLKLRGEVGRLRRESTVSNTPITRDLVESRYKNAQELARSGNSADALKEFLWCFDLGMPRVSGYAGVRTSFLLSSIAKLGEEYPAALTALRERRDKASQQMLNSKNDSDATMEFAALNRTLKEDQNTLAVFDQLPAEDPRRQTLAGAAYDQLVEAQRYGDALVGRPYANISAHFEMGKAERPLPANIANAEEIRKSQRTYLINSTAKNVEVLAGSGDVVHARALADRLLAFDTSPETKALLQQHATRAGQAGLLDGVPNP